MQRASPGHGVWVRCPPPAAAELGGTQGRAMKVQDTGHLQVSETIDQRHHRELQSSGGTEKTSRIIISQPVPCQFYLMLSSWTKF